MLSGQTQRILETAAAESVERIRRDRANAPQRLKPLLAYIEEHLFDPSLDVNQLKRNCGVRDNSVPIQFHSAVGRPPHGYIEDRRLETACRLLGESPMKIWQISEVLGYSSIQVFSRAFSRWSGQRPTTYRKKARHRKEVHPEVPQMVEESLEARTEMLRRAIAGELSLDEANALILRLRQLYPEPEPAITIGSTSGSAGYGSSLAISSARSPEQDLDGVDFWDAKMRLETLLNTEELEGERRRADLARAAEALLAAAERPHPRPAADHLEPLQPAAHQEPHRRPPRPAARRADRRPRLEVARRGRRNGDRPRPARRLEGPGLGLAGQRPRPGQRPARRRAGHLRGRAFPPAG